jgi:hypothetical protein
MSTPEPRPVIGRRPHHLQAHPARARLHERESRVTLATRLTGKTAAETISVMLAVFAQIEPATQVHLRPARLAADHARHDHLVLRRLCLVAKGGVENANGRLRRWLPRQIDIDTVSDEKIQDIVLTTKLTPPENALASRHHSRQSSKSLAKTCKSASHRPVALRSRIHAPFVRSGVLHMARRPRGSRRPHALVFSLAVIEARQLSCAS